MFEYGVIVSALAVGISLAVIVARVVYQSIRGEAWRD